jgi:hypothetical protein
MGLIDSPLGRRCGAQEETSAHFGDTQVYLFGLFFLDPEGLRSLRLGAV